MLLVLTLNTLLIIDNSESVTPCKLMKFQKFKKLIGLYNVLTIYSLHCEGFFASSRVCEWFETHIVSPLLPSTEVPFLFSTNFKVLEKLKTTYNVNEKCEPNGSSL